MSGTTSQPNTPRELLPALAELALRDGKHPIAGRVEVDDRRLERPRAGRREDEHFVLRAIDRAQPLLGDGEDLGEIGRPVVDDRPRERAQHLRRHRGRAGVRSCCGRDIRLSVQRAPRRTRRRLRAAWTSCSPLPPRSSRCGSRRPRAALAQPSDTRAARLEWLARRFRSGVGGAGLGRRGGVGRPRVPRLLPLRRAAHRSAAWRRLSSTCPSLVCHARRARLHRPGRRRRSVGPDRPGGHRGPTSPTRPRTSRSSRRGPSRSWGTSQEPWRRSRWRRWASGGARSGTA